jgi:hypothetical protein
MHSYEMSEPHFKLKVYKWTMSDSEIAIYGFSELFKMLKIVITSETLLIWKLITFIRNVANLTTWKSTILAAFLCSLSD